MVRINRAASIAWKLTAALSGLTLLASCLTASAQMPSATDAKTKRTAATPKFESCAKPVYPKEDLAANHQGTVELEFLVAADGKVTDSRLIKSSGFPSLDDEARTALSKCQFIPGTMDGKIVSAWTRIHYTWKLE